MLPEMAGRRVLVEVADPAAGRAGAARLQAEGFEAVLCDGRGPGGRGCPLLRGLPCRLVGRADVVLCGLPDGRITNAVLGIAGERAQPVPDLDARSVLEPLRLVRARRTRHVRRLIQARDRRLLVRSAQPSDAARIRAFENGLSERTRRLRYLSYMPPLTTEQAVQQASVDFDRRFAFVAIEGQGDQRRIVADARLLADTRHEGQAEVAIAVADHLQGAGVGPQMLGLLIEVAAERGFEAVCADVWWENRPIVRVLRGLGFQRTGWDLDVLTFTKRLASRHAAQ